MFIIPKEIVEKYLDSVRLALNMNNSMGDSQTNSQKFTLTLGKGFVGYPKYYKLDTIIHEVLHLITNRKNQLELSEKTFSSCPGYYDSIRNWCYKKDSLLTKFADRFYKKENNKWVPKIDGPVGVYFVSSYAKRNTLGNAEPGEDIAESFISYILETNLYDKNSGTVRFKINFFGEDANYQSEDLDLRKIKREFRELIGKSEYCKEIGSIQTS